MSLWEYKVITSGKGGFATPALLEKFLSDLGRDEWEIVQYQSPPDNFLAFTGLARRSTQRDWTLQDAAAAAAKVEAEKLRAEFEAKFKAASNPAPAGGEERAPSFLEEKSAPDDGLRKLVDTSRDDDPEAQEDDKNDDWDKLTAAEEDELPTFFDAIKPHMRRNQRGPGMSVGADYLAKKWDQSEDDVRGALVECGFVVPADEDAKVEYLEYDGDLYWLNINRRGELWINTKEKPRPIFRAVKAVRIEVEPPVAKEEKPAAGESPQPATGDQSAGDQPASPESAAVELKPEGKRPSGTRLPEGAALIAKIRPHMRRNRRGPGGSGSTTFLARALRTSEADLKAAFVGFGFVVPASASDKIVFIEIGDELWWLNEDSRGGLWINGREKMPGETLASATAAAAAPASPEATPAAATPSVTGEAAAAVPTTPVTSEPTTSDGPAPTAPEAPVPPTLEIPSVASVEPGPVTATAEGAAPDITSPLAAARPLLKETRTGAFADRIDRLAEKLGKLADNLVTALVGIGLSVPEKAREKPVTVAHAGEILWLSKNAKGELWLNAKAAKSTDQADDDAESGDDAATGDGDDEKKPARRGSRGSKKPE